MNLSMSKCRGQCYDGASNMRGSKTGVAKKLLNDEPRAVFIHCYGHDLNLAAGDSIKKCKVSFCNFHAGGAGAGGTGRGNKYLHPLVQFYSLYKMKTPLLCLSI